MSKTIPSSQFRAQFESGLYDPRYGNGNIEGPYISRNGREQVVYMERPIEQSQPYYTDQMVPVYREPRQYPIINKEIVEDIAIQYRVQEEPEGFFHEAYRHVVKPIGVGVAAPIGGAAALVGGTLFGVFSVARGVVGLIPLGIDWVLKPVGAGAEAVVDWGDDKVKYMLGYDKDKDSEVLMITDTPIPVPSQRIKMIEEPVTYIPASGYMKAPPTASFSNVDKLGDPIPFEDRRIVEPSVRFGRSSFGNGYNTPLSSLNLGSANAANKVAFS